MDIIDSAIRVAPGCASGVLAAIFPQAAAPIIITGVGMGALLYAIPETGQSTFTKAVEGLIFNALAVLFVVGLGKNDYFSSVSDSICSGNTTPVAIGGLLTSLSASKEEIAGRLRASRSPHAAPQSAALYCSP